MKRRKFLGKLLSGLVLAAGGVGAAYPVASFVSFRRTAERQVIFHPSEQGGRVIQKDGVFLVREAEKTVALSARCTHLGCILGFDEARGEFRCPCHGSVFSLAGRRRAGPARRDLAQIPLQHLENGDIMVIVPA